MKQIRRISPDEGTVMGIMYKIELDDERVLVSVIL